MQCQWQTASTLDAYINVDCKRAGSMCTCRLHATQTVRATTCGQHLSSMSPRLMTNVPGTGFTCAHLPCEKTCSPGFSSVAKIVKTPQSVCAPAPYMPCNAWSNRVSKSCCIGLAWAHMHLYQTGLLHNVWHKSGINKAVSWDVHATPVAITHNNCNTAHSSIAGIRMRANLVWK